MITPNLWDKLQPNPATLDILKRDLSEGKVPNLPFFIVDQAKIKQEIGTRLAEIDGDRMQTNLIIAQYGNGKTNLLKYLQLYFDTQKLGIDVLYSRADIDQPDLIKFTLKLLQDNYTDKLIEYIKVLGQTKDIGATLANNYFDNFAGIKEYTEALFVADRTDDELRRLIYLGTGRLYTKGHFKEFELHQITDFERREVLVLFFNILSASNHYVVVGIDEIEKIQEKSKLRLNHFLTSYREMIDLFNKIKGHYMLTCFTDATGSFEIQAANEALYTRIKKQILELPPINKRDDFVELLNYLNELFETNKGSDAIEIIITSLIKAKHYRNRDILQHAVELLREEEVKIDITQLLDEYDLTNLFNSTKNKLELDGAMKSLRLKFFDPLLYFLEDNGLIENESELERQKYAAYIDLLGKKVHHFIFNENKDLALLNTRLNAIVADYGMDLVIYSPEKLELSNSDIQIEDASVKFKIVDYVPEELYTLLNMYRDNFEYKESIGKIISNYTEKNL